MFYFFAFVVAVFISNARDAESIFGGVDGELKDFPYMISVRKNGLHECGGAIIDFEYVLTAAHCVINDKNEFIDATYTVVAGISQLSDIGPTRVEIIVDKAFVSTLYDGTSPTSIGDIAVLKLKEKFDLGPKSGLAKIPLPRSTKLLALNPYNSFARKEAVVSGFGWNNVEIKLMGEKNSDIVDDEEGYSSGKLLKAKANIVPNDRCQRKLTSPIQDSQLCANIVEHDKDVVQGVCTGDRGGPLVSEGKLVGIVSYNALGCDDSDLPAIYTRVSEYIDLINNAKRITDDIRIETY